MSYHVLPVDDIKPHTQESTCTCIPVLKEENGEMIFVHNSFDCREALEKALATEDTESSMKWYILYVEELYYMEKFGLVKKDWVREKIECAFSKMYEHWRKMDVEIKWEEK